MTENNENKNNDNQSLVKNSKNEITTPPKEIPFSINMVDLARQGLEEVKKHGGEFKARQEQKINQDGTASMSQYVGINVPSRDLKIEDFQTQEIPHPEKKLLSETTEKQFKPGNLDEKPKTTASQENFSQVEEAKELVANTVDSNPANTNNNSGSESSE